jgi:hypothetical protein
MAEPTYTPIIALAKLVFRGLGLRFTVSRRRARAEDRRRGHGRQPRRLPRLHLRRPGRAAAGRLVRFMAKKEVLRPPAAAAR